MKKRPSKKRVKKAGHEVHFRTLTEPVNGKPVIYPIDYFVENSRGIFDLTFPPVEAVFPDRTRPLTELVEE